MLRPHGEKSAVSRLVSIVTNSFPDSEDATPPAATDGAVPLSALADDPAAEDSFERAYRLLQRLGNRWTFPILGMLRRQPMRFAKLKRSLEPVSQRMLTLSLRRLERDALVYREEKPGQPPQVTYGLTPLGMALVGRLKDFEAWLRAHPTPCSPRPRL
jgi:DNA-binding HxlR family transcriptional regulator